MMVYEKKYINNKEYEQHKIKYGAPISLRLNDQERKKVEEFRNMADIASLSEAIKVLMEVGHNVLHGRSTIRPLERLFKKERARNP